MHSEHGVSLPGLMLTLTLAAILATLAAPVFSDIAADARLRSGTEKLYMAIRYARSEAILRARPVVIAARGDDWESGWEVFIDANIDGHRQSEEVLLREADGPSQRLSIEANSGIGRAIHYRSDGRTQRPSGSLQMGTVRLCRSDAGGQPHAGQAIVINAAGRPRISTDPPRPDTHGC